MPFHDLDVPYTPNHAELSHTLAFHAELGYSVVALSVSVTGKLPATPPTIPVSSLTLPKSITTVLTRLTLTISDAAQNHRLASLQPQYTLLALRPTNEKALQLCCNSLDCDLISLDFSQRLPCLLKFKTVASALQRGVRFEICYAPGVQGGGNNNDAARRNLISGAASLIRATRGRGIILSSEAKTALALRGPYDVINLAQIWGLGQERGKEALCEEAAKVVRLAALKRTSFRGVVDVLDGGGRVEEEEMETKSTAKNAESLKRQKQATSVREQSKGTASRPAPGSAIGARDQKAPGTKDGDAETDVLPPNGQKRKASFSIPETGQNQPTRTTQDQSANEENPLSKREIKRRAKKARLEGNAPGLDAG